MSTLPASAVAQKRAIGPPPVSSARYFLSPGSSFVVPARRHDPGVVVLEVAFLRSRNRGLIPGMLAIDRIAKRIGLHKRLRLFPIVVVRTAKQNANAEVDVDQIGGHQLAVNNHTRRDIHRSCPTRSCSCRCSRRRSDR